MAQFRVTSTTLHGAVFALDGEHFTVGRAPDNDLRLGHPSISQHHAKITVDQGHFKFWDLYSTNGTFINGERTVFRRLQDGDRLVLGEIHLHFDVHGTAPPQPPPPAEVSLDETQLLAGVVRKPRSQSAQIRAATPAGPPPAPNTTVAVIAPATAPVASKKPVTNFLSPLRPAQPDPLPTHKEIRESLPPPIIKSFVEIPPLPTNTAVQASRQRLIALVILMAGGFLLGVGYSANNATLKILGLAGAITGGITLILAPRD